MQNSGTSFWLRDAPYQDLRTTTDLPSDVQNTIVIGKIYIPR